MRCDAVWMQLPLFATGVAKEHETEVFQMTTLNTKATIVNGATTTTLTMKVKSVRAGEYTAPPAQGPMIIEIWGTTPDASTFLWGRNTERTLVPKHSYRRNSSFSCYMFMLMLVYVPAVRRLTR